MSINLYYLPACIYLCAKFYPAQCLNSLNGFDFRSDFFFYIFAYSVVRS